MALSIAVYQMMRFADVILLGALASVAATGQYTAASSVAQIISIYPLALSQALGPRIADLYQLGDMEMIAAELRRYVRLASILGGYLFAGVAVFGVDLDLLFGSEFRFSLTLTTLLAAGWYLSATLAPFGYVLSMTGRHRIELAILLLGAVVLLAFLILLIPLYSEVGAALSVLISFALVNTVRCIYVLRVIRQSPLLLAHLLPPLFFLSAAFLCQTVGNYFEVRSFLILLLECLLYTLCAAVIYFGIFATEAEKQKVLLRLRTGSQ
ncbi:lipopolysaccharide biosynthesis protein [Microvirga aerilata]